MYDNDGNDEEMLSVTGQGAGIITLNRPYALNALTLEMIRLLSGRLMHWERDETVKAVLFNGAGDRAFCAGGDVKMAYRMGMACRRGEIDEKVVTVFFGEEYAMNRQIFHYTKPRVAFMEGIVMGGGFGVAGPCTYRIATNTTRFAMPETGIGFFPDVGSMYYLTRCPGYAGAYLAVTGDTIDGADTLYCGLATHFIPGARLQKCRKDLHNIIASAACPEAVNEGIKAVLDRYHEPPAQKGALETHAALVDNCFTYNNVEKILDALTKTDDPWAKQKRALILSRSPLSLKIARAYYEWFRDRDFDAIIDQDFILMQHFMADHDYYEGVRALLIDKDRNPQWQPATLEAVSDDLVREYFTPTGYSLKEAVGL